MQGKEKCKALKEIRKQIAENNDIKYVVEECKHKGDCKGTCPRCEAEVRYLEKELEKRRVLGQKVAIAGVSLGIAATFSACTTSSGDIIPGNDLGGAPSAPYEEELAGDPIEIIPEDDTDGETQNDQFSDNVTGSIMQVMYDVIGQDQETAEKMIGGFFGVELNDSLGNIMTNERNGIVTKMHVYTDMFVKDSVRFNSCQIWTDEKDGHVRRVELSLDNNGLISVPIDDTPEFQSEIKSLYEDVNDELKISLGQPKDSGANMWDEDSFWAYYQISNDRFAYVEVNDYTEPGGNGLVSTTVVFADSEVLLD